ncbi:MAG TPA: NADH:flavin oxidoreductase [Bacillales bacterium]|nr:NADH:flavin oxidoreductase [Bacillales bacterium]
MTLNENLLLFQDFTLNGLTLKNGIAVSPMTRTSGTEDGQVTDQIINYYERYAKGGFSLIFTEGLYLDESYSQGYYNQPGIANSKQMEGWRKVVDAVHKHDAAIFAQLMHAGALSQGNHYTETRIAPSAVQPKGEQLEMYGGHGKFPVPEEITVQQIRQAVEAFADSAVRAKRAGFDGIEIHGANGYIIDQFLTDYTNQRTDEYGGTLTKRLRFAKEVIHAVRDAVGPDYPVSIRLSQGKVNDFTHKWESGEADATVIFEAIAEAGVDFIHVTEYDATQPAFGAGQTLAALAKKYGRLPVIANGNLEEPDKAEQLVASGNADVITLGKGALANPDWPNRIKEGLPLEDFDANIIQPQANIKEQELRQKIAVS